MAEQVGKTRTRPVPVRMMDTPARVYSFTNFPSNRFTLAEVECLAP